MTAADLPSATPDPAPPATGPARPSARKVVCPLPGGRVLTVSAVSLDLPRFIATLAETLAAARKARRLGLTLSTLSKVFRDTAATGGGA